MATSRFFCESLTKGTVRLNREESHHAINALRMKTGDAVTLFDGHGTEGAGLITGMNGHEAEIEVGSLAQYPYDLCTRLTLAVAMPKAHRQGYLIEKCTELGVASIWPIYTDRATSRPSKAAVGKWTRRAIEAAKQAQRRWIPQIAAPQPFAESLRAVDAFDLAVLTHSAEPAVRLLELMKCEPKPASVIAWVGPEGGWSENELGQAHQAGLGLANLGPTILRTETAAVATCAAIALTFGRNPDQP